MVVLDASAIVDLLIHRRLRGEWVAERLAGADVAHSPHLVDVEVASALRRLTSVGGLDVGVATRALGLLAELRLRRYPATVLLPRIWSLRAILSSYDATYVALAEALDLPLVTTDARLARTKGHRAKVIAFATAE